MTHRCILFTGVLCIASLALRPSELNGQDRQPYTIGQLIRMVESGVFSDSRVLLLARESCISFRIDEESETRLTEAGASESLLGGLRRVCIRLPREVTWILLSPRELDLPVGVNRALRAQALGPDSVPIPNTVFEWTSEDTSVVDVSMGGMVLGKTPGTTQITARSGDGTAGTATVTVTTGAVSAGGGDEPAESEAVGAKSAATAGALGVVFPGGGEFYAGNTTKGVVALLGVAGALAAGFLLASDDTLSITPTEPPVSSCSDGSCTFDVTAQFEIEESKMVPAAIAVAGAFWFYAFVDGIRAAKGSSSASTTAAMGPASGAAIELAPADGIWVSSDGEVELILIRVRW